MQQTSKYQFNLVENTDDFSPTPLNQNMEKVEEELEGLETELEGIAADLGSGGKNCRIAWGQYTGTGTFGAGSPNSLSFDFCPVAVIVGAYERASFGSWPSVFLRPCTASHPDVGGNALAVTWTGTGLSWYSTVHQDSQNNSGGYTYYYVALGYAM